ncbi:MAG: ABC transporter substrate-binding protein [Deltaproteobacteria bacterium]|nr:ABC transporter substrate-binding protein [Deltaproteobacteria bacterium]
MWLDTLRVAPTCYHVLHLIPVMIAHEMNFFVDEGLCRPSHSLAYEIVPGGLVPFGLEKLGLAQGMKERAIDIALDVQAITPLYQRLKRKADVYIIAGWRNQKTAVWVGSSDVRSLSELKGKRLGIIDYGDIIFKGVRPWLRESGLDPEKDVEWVRGVYPTGGLSALRSGKVDAMSVSPWEAEQLRAEGYNILLKFKEKYPRGHPDRVIVASGYIINEHPDLVKAFLKAMIRAYWFVREQPENFKYIYQLEKRLRRQSPDPEESGGRFSSASPEHLEYMPFPVDGLPTGLDVILKEEYDAGEIDTLVDPEEACYLDLARESYKELAARPELKEEHERVKGLRDRLGF